MKREAFDRPLSPTEKIKDRKWLPGNVTQLVRKEKSWGKSTGQRITEYRLEDGTEFGEEVTDTYTGDLISRKMYLREGETVRQLLWEPATDEVKEYITTKEPNGAVHSGWVKLN